MSVTGVSLLEQGIDINNITESGVNTDNSVSFGKLFESALNMINETNTLQKSAEQAEMNYAMGYSDNTHDLAIAQQKANISLQYTKAVRDKVLEAYKEIMQMQM